MLLTTPKIAKKGAKSHASVLAGGEKVSDMLVFIMYRKLKRVMRGGTVAPVSRPERKNDARGD